MNLEEIYENYFSKGTRGYRILSRFYNKYSDLFKKTTCSNFDDFSNQIFLNISKINFSKNIINIEAYLIGAIKIQCRSLLDKAIKSKKIIPQSRLIKFDEEENEDLYGSAPVESNKNVQFEEFALSEMYRAINDFKLQLSQKEILLLNHLIDERTRNEIAKKYKLKLNTVDTNIRRLRIKLSRFLKGIGYTNEVLDRFS